MAHTKQRQALAVSSRLSPVAALEQEAAKIFAASEEKRMNGGASGHIVIDGGVLKGFVKDAHTMVQFTGGSVAVTTHD